MRLCASNDDDDDDDESACNVIKSKDNVSTKPGLDCLMANNKSPF